MDFDAAAPTWDDDEQHTRRTRAIAEEIRRLLGERTYHRALDFGAGTGALSMLLADRFDEILLVDTSSAMLAVAARKVTTAGPATTARLVPLVVDLTSPGAAGRPQPGSVDVVYSSMALHHVPDTDALLRTFHQLTVPDGLLLIADLAADEGGSHRAGDQGFGGYHGFRRDDLEAALVAAGFAPTAYSTVFAVRTVDDDGVREYPVFLAVARRLP